MSQDELKFAQKKFSVNDRGSNETLDKIEADFLMHPKGTFDFGMR